MIDIEHTRYTNWQPIFNQEHKNTTRTNRNIAHNKSEWCRMFNLRPI